MKSKDLRQKTDAELHKLLSDMRKKLFEGRFALSSGKVKNVSSLRELRRDIARVRTLLAEQIRVSFHPK